MVASVRLSKRGTEAPVAEGEKKSKYEAIAPQAAMYGIYGPQYSALLAGTQNNPITGPADRATLANMSEREKQEYAQALHDANETQKELQKRDAYYGFLTEMEKNLQGDVDRGMGGVRQAPVWDENSAVVTPGFDQTMIRRSNNVVLNQAEADRLKTKADAYGALADKLGVKPSDAYLSTDLANPNSDPTDEFGGKVPIETNFKSPALQVTEHGTDQGLNFDQQMEIAQVKANAAANGDDIEAVTTIGSNGVAQTVYKGTPEALARAGIDVVTGKKLNPNAGANGGAAPATPAAPATTKVTAANQGSLTDYRDPGYDVIEAKLEAKYPQLPKGLLRRIRMHGEKSNANEVSPAGARTVYQIIPSTRKRFADKYKIDGWSSPEAAAEVAALHLVGSIQRGGDPVREYIGGTSKANWGKDTQAYATRVNNAKTDPVTTTNVYGARLQNVPGVQKVATLDNGDTLVYMQDGTQRVYRKGKRIG